MAYPLTGTTTATAIKEREYATAAVIKFTKFTSCIGVIAKKGDEMTAVHLAMRATDGSDFDTAAATAVLDLLPKDPDAAAIFGCISMWENPDNRVLAGFQKLTGTLETLTKFQKYTFVDGEYGAKIEDGDIEITY